VTQARPGQATRIESRWWRRVAGRGCRARDRAHDGGGRLQPPRGQYEEGRLLKIVSWLLAAALAAPFDAIVADARCADAIDRTLQRWGARRELALVDPPTPMGARTGRLPTPAIGRWVRLTVSGGEAQLERVGPTTLETYRFDRACEAHSEAATPLPAVRAGGFGDAQLARLLATGATGVILIWSPHMPLSVDQYRELSAAAAAMRVDVVALLDPLADAGFAARVAGERGLPAATLRPAAGVELAFRGMTTHAPSLQVFARGRLAGPVLYGYRPRAALQAALEAVLDSAASTNDR
jgi:hypothetical protein